MCTQKGQVPFQMKFFKDEDGENGLEDTGRGEG